MSNASKTSMIKGVRLFLLRLFRHATRRAVQLPMGGLDLGGSPLERDGRSVSRPAGGEVAAVVQAALDALDPALPHLQSLHSSVRAVLEANQAGPPRPLPALSHLADVVRGRGFTPLRLQRSDS